MRKGDKRLKYEDRKEIEKMKNDGVRVVVIGRKNRSTPSHNLQRVKTWRDTLQSGSSTKNNIGRI